MSNVSLPAAAPAPLRSLAGVPADPSAGIAAAAQLLLPHLERGSRIDAVILRAAMEHVFGGSDAAGAWDWKTAYEACEAATVLFMRKFGPAIRARAGSPAAELSMLNKIAALLPTHTRRSEESQALQQFSTPLALGFVAASAAAIGPADLMLEPSAGTGLSAIFAELAGSKLHLNELAETRAALLGRLFPAVATTRYDAAHIHDHLDEAVRPSVVLMNPPFSVAAHVDGTVADAALRHVSSALARLADGGRLVAITSASLSPDYPSWREALVRLQERGRVVFSAAVDGRVYARHGTAVETRLTVIDRVPADDPRSFPASPGMAPDVATLLQWVTSNVPPRLPVEGTAVVPASVSLVAIRPSRRTARQPLAVAGSSLERAATELAYETVDWKPAEGGSLTEALYEGYDLQSIRIAGALPHPTRLVQSAAMASVAPPKPSYRPHLPADAVSVGMLSDAQLESVIYAGEAHAGCLAGSWVVDETFDTVFAAPDDATNAVRFRRGWMLGDGTGAGKGRQVAGILLDNWLKGRRRAVWIHYLLEAGWKADTAVQGLGRSNRTNQAQPPLFRPIATDVKAEKRFLSTIARRLDTLGAITKGQRQTGGQGLFRADDNLESPYGRAALRQLYLLLFAGKVPGCSLEAFQGATGLHLTDQDGSLREELPPITTFLNRLLALTIELQNTLFGVFEGLLRAKIEGARASGTYDVGIETLTAESLTVIQRQVVHVHPTTGAETQVFTVRRRERNQPLALTEALDRAGDPRAVLLVNAQSGRAAVQVPAPSVMLDDGEVERRVRLVRPMERTALSVAALEQSHWQRSDQAAFAQAWARELAEIPHYTESELHIVTGLLLPIWKRLPDESMRVYRLQTDAGERVIGRLVSPAWVAQAVSADDVSLASADAWTAVLDGRTILELQDGLSVRRSKVMGLFRVELCGFTDGMVDRLKAMGLISEIIAWKLRLFVPTGATGPSILAPLVERYPIVRITDRAAA